ncbi:hypothetical protein MMC12_001314, partial [Toensbergia leucococca]|nr:hypothetical protein [Toensbergia leucococca]
MGTGLNAELGDGEREGRVASGGIGEHAPLRFGFPTPASVNIEPDVPVWNDWLITR